MSGSLSPDISYTDDVTYPRSQVWVEIGKSAGTVDWFVIQLEYNANQSWYDSDDWKQVARFDHHPQMSWGHDITKEELHLDIYNKNGVKETVMYDFPAVPLKSAPEYCNNYLRRQEPDY